MWHFETLFINLEIKTVESISSYVLPLWRRNDVGTRDENRLQARDSIFLRRTVQNKEISGDL